MVLSILTPALMTSAEFGGFSWEKSETMNEYPFDRKNCSKSRYFGKPSNIFIFLSSLRFGNKAITEFINSGSSLQSSGLIDDNNSSSFCNYRKHE